MVTIRDCQPDGGAVGRHHMCTLMDAESVKRETEHPVWGGG
jgi:hypothetical protein